MENFITVLFNTRKVKKSVVETMIASSGQGLNEDNYEAIMFEHDDGGIGIRLSIPSQLTDEQSDAVADKLAEALFEKGYNDFEIETSLNESDAPRTFKPTHFHKSNLFGAKTSLMYHNGNFYHMKANEEGRKEITRWYPGPMGVNNRSKLNPGSVDGEIVNGKFVEYPKGTTFADTQKGNTAPQTSAELDTDSKDSGTSKGKQDGPDSDKPAKGAKGCGGGPTEDPVEIYAVKSGMCSFWSDNKKLPQNRLKKAVLDLTVELNDLLMSIGESALQQEIYFTLNEAAGDDKKIKDLMYKITILVGLNAVEKGGANHRYVVDVVKRARKVTKNRAGTNTKPDATTTDTSKSDKNTTKKKDKGMADIGMDAKEAEVRKKFARFIALLDLASGKSKTVMASMYTESLDALTADERKELDSLFNELQDSDIVNQLSNLGLDVAKQLNRYLDVTKDKKPEDTPAIDTKNLDTFAKSDKGGLANDPDEVEAIKELQRALGFEGDDVDGKYGPKTIEAVKKFQEENDLTVDGDAGPKTIAKIQELNKKSGKLSDKLDGKDGDLSTGGDNVDPDANDPRGDQTSPPQVDPDANDPRGDQTSPPQADADANDPRGDQTSPPQADAEEPVSFKDMGDAQTNRDKVEIGDTVTIGGKPHTVEEVPGLPDQKFFKPVEDAEKQGLTKDQKDALAGRGEYATNPYEGLPFNQQRSMFFDTVRKTRTIGAGDRKAVEQFIEAIDIDQLDQQQLVRIDSSISTLITTLRARGKGELGKPFIEYRRDVILPAIKAGGTQSGGEPVTGTPGGFEDRPGADDAEEIVNIEDQFFGEAGDMIEKLEKLDAEGFYTLNERLAEMQKGTIVSMIIDNDPTARQKRRMYDHLRTLKVTHQAMLDDIVRGTDKEEKAERKGYKLLRDKIYYFEGIGDIGIGLDGSYELPTALSVSPEEVIADGFVRIPNELRAEFGLSTAKPKYVRLSDNGVAYIISHNADGSGSGPIVSSRTNKEEFDKILDWAKENDYEDLIPPDDNTFASLYPDTGVFNNRFVKEYLEQVTLFDLGEKNDNLRKMIQHLADIDPIPRRRAQSILRKLKRWHSDDLEEIKADIDSLGDEEPDQKEALELLYVLVKNLKGEADMVIESFEHKALEETYDDDNDFFEAYGYLGVPDEELWEAEYQGRTVKLNKPMRGDVKKFKVYVKNSKGNVIKVNFGDPNSKIKKSNPARRRSFRARHNCDNPGPKTKARYWSCRKW